jgi:single-strand DNA-binding protein
MSMSLNRAQIIGNLTRDPETRQTPSGRSVANFGIATNHRWTDASGQKQEKVEFHNVVVWGKLAEICAQYLKKGSKVFVEGRLQTREWEGQDGVKRYRTEIVADNMIMLDRKGAPIAGGVEGIVDREPAGIGIDEEPPAEEAKEKKSPKEEVAVEDLPF